MGSREVSVGISGMFGVSGRLGSWGRRVTGSGTRARSAASVLLRGLSWGLQGGRLLSSFRVRGLEKYIVRPGSSQALVVVSQQRPSIIHTLACTIRWEFNNYRPGTAISRCPSNSVAIVNIGECYWRVKFQFVAYVQNSIEWVLVRRFLDTLNL